MHIYMYTPKRSTRWKLMYLRSLPGFRFAKHRCLRTVMLGISALPVDTDAAVTDAATRRTHPVWVEQRGARVFLVAIAQTRSAELAAHAVTRVAATDGLRVERLLSALVAVGAVLFVPLLLARVRADVVEFCLGNVGRWTYHAFGFLCSQRVAVAKRLDIDG